MVKNPITSIIGLLVALCPIVSAVWPEAKDICEKLIGELIGLGFIVASDGIKVPSASTVKTSIVALLSSVALIGSLTACAQLEQVKKQAEELMKTVTDVVKDYSKPDCKDGETPEKNGCDIPEKSVTQ